VVECEGFVFGGRSGQADWFVASGARTRVLHGCGCEWMERSGQVLLRGESGASLLGFLLLGARGSSPPSKGAYCPESRVLYSQLCHFLVVIRAEARLVRLHPPVSTPTLHSYTHLCVHTKQAHFRIHTHFASPAILFTPVLEACRENGVTLVAYSPLCQGLLTGEAAARALDAVGCPSRHAAPPAASPPPAVLALWRGPASPDTKSWRRTCVGTLREPPLPAYY
jgi:hypothetical protein